MICSFVSSALGNGFLASWKKTASMEKSAIFNEMERVRMQIDKLRGDQLDQLFDAVLSLKTREECYRFFDDIATTNEIQALTGRLQVAKMLLDGDTYQTIENETNASTATISRVRRCIGDGNDGYRMVLKRIDDGNS